MDMGKFEVRLWDILARDQVGSPCYTLPLTEEFGMPVAKLTTWV
jgi:hypothetical protein